MSSDKKAYSDKSKMCLIFELLTGGELFDHIADRSKFSERDAARVLRQILRGLAALHGRGVAHLDLKPSNICFSTKDEDAVIKIIDYGLARTIPAPPEAMAFGT